MKAGRWLAVLVLVSAFACILLTSCDEEEGYWYSFFHMKIDSLSAPAEIMQTDTLRITFYSEPLDCCHNFYRYDNVLDYYIENTLYIRIYGSVTHNLLCMCLPRIIEMEYEVTQMLTGYFYIEVLQPDGSSLIDSVLVYR